MQSEKLAKAVADAIPVIQNHAIGRLHEAIDMIERGDINEALGEIANAQARLSRLTWVEQHVAPFANSLVIKVRDVAEGITLAEWGVVAEKKAQEQVCPSGHQHDTVWLRFESGHEVTLAPDDEVMIVSTDD